MTEGETLRDLSDRLSIGDLVARFSDAANRRDRAAFRALWTDDAIWTIGPPVDLRVEGGDEIARTFMTLMDERWELFIQLPSAAQIVMLDGGRATARLYMTETAQSKGGDGNYNISVYQDRLLRVDGTWLFARRDYRSLYLDRTPLAGGAPADT